MPAIRYDVEWLAPPGVPVDSEGSQNAPGPERDTWVYLGMVQRTLLRPEEKIKKIAKDSLRACRSTWPAPIRWRAVKVWSDGTREIKKW